MNADGGRWMPVPVDRIAAGDVIAVLRAGAPGAARFLAEEAALYREPDTVATVLSAEGVGAEGSRRIAVRTSVDDAPWQSAAEGATVLLRRDR